MIMCVWLCGGGGLCFGQVLKLFCHKLNPNGAFDISYSLIWANDMAIEWVTCRCNAIAIMHQNPHPKNIFVSFLMSHFRMCVFVCVCVYMCVYVYVYVCACMYMCVHVCICVCVHTYNVRILWVSSKSCVRSGNHNTITTHWFISQQMFSQYLTENVQHAAF